MVHAQTNIALGGFTADTNAPIEITADSLSVDQDTGAAKFSGNVFIGQGALKLSAEHVEVVYSAEDNEISRLAATGSVTARMTGDKKRLLRVRWRQFINLAPCDGCPS